MKLLGILLFTATALAGASCATSAPDVRASALRGHGVDAWTRYLVPDQAESAWRGIPWIPKLADGVNAAGESNSLILLWVMNGHPLGCT